MKPLRRLSEVSCRADLLRLFFKFEKYGRPFPASEPGVIRLHLLLPFGYRMRRVVSPMPELPPKFICTLFHRKHLHEFGGAFRW